MKNIPDDMRVVELNPVENLADIARKKMKCPWPPWPDESEEEHKMKLQPPVGYNSWLQYAAENMDTRMLHLESIDDDSPLHRLWGREVQRDEMMRAVREEYDQFLRMKYRAAMKPNEKLLAGWKRRLEMRAEGDKLCDEGSRLHTESRKLYAKGKKLWDKLILEVHGNIEMEWKWNKKYGNNECHLANGEVYGFEGSEK